MGFLRFLLPRRKENVINVAIFLILVGGCVYCLRYMDLTGAPSEPPKSELWKVEPVDGELAPGLRPHVRPDYSQPRTGPGENGAAVYLTGEEDKQAKELMKKWFMNVVASDKISLDRSIPDTRHAECKKTVYPKILPTASVVIIFHEEAWTPLLRTVHSVVNRSPPHLLHEVVLLDDASTREELKDKLTDYVKIFGGLVKLVRVKERQGLVRARLEGAKAATGDVLIFLDSHCEANAGWLEPLLARIGEKRSAVLCPLIDAISDSDMTYPNYPGSVAIGGFSWSLFFNWFSRPKDLVKPKTQPVE